MDVLRLKMELNALYGRRGRLDMRKNRRAQTIMPAVEDNRIFEILAYENGRVIRHEIHYYRRHTKFGRYTGTYNGYREFLRLGLSANYGKTGYWKD